MSRPRWSRAPAVIARWLLGTGLVTWRYLWETTPLYRGGECRGDDHDRPPQLPPEAVDDRVQRAEDGYGPLFHRSFRVRIADADIDAGRLIEQVCRDFERFVPTEVVSIHADGLRGQGLDVADELVVEMPGPWNGPVRVVHRDARSLHLVTLHGHMEAGQVQFRAREDGDLLVFEIELWARAGSRLVHLLYAHLRLAKEVQLNMWVRFCLSAVAASGGRLRDGVHISTRWLDPPGPRRVTRTGGRRGRRTGTRRLTRTGDEPRDSTRGPGNPPPGGRAL